MKQSVAAWQQRRRLRGAVWRWQGWYLDGRDIGVRNYLRLGATIDADPFTELLSRIRTRRGNIRRHCLVGVDDAVSIDGVQRVLCPDGIGGLKEFG